MCGITGFFHYCTDRKASPELIKLMADKLIHRGPDGEGFFVKNQVALGHRRLSIIDLQTGDQPMFSEDKKIVLIFNGEIYNYVELRKELIELGFVFRTSSDTEVIIQSYKKWGIDCLKKFNGCWSFALYDESKDSLFLSRDRLGEKPLFYSESDKSFLFGSEIKSILAYGTDFKPAPEYTELYLSLGYIPAPFTFYKNIKKLQPGHSLLVNSDGCKVIKYWDLPQLSELEMNHDKHYIYENFESLLNDSVRIRMRSDVSFGAFLSGGLDSSSIVALMANQSPFPVETFTIGFENKIFDERRLANDVSEAFQTIHHTRTIEPESFNEALNTIVFHYDEPYGDSSAIAVSNISSYASEKVKMILTGDGGVEVLSGYNSYLGLKITNWYRGLPFSLRNQVPTLTNSLASIFSGNLRYKLNRLSNISKTGNLGFEERIMQKMAWTDFQSIKNMVSTLPERQFPIEDLFSDLLSKCPFKDEFYRLMFINLKLTLPDDMLTKVDRMTMAHSLEGRIPFLDHRLVEFMYGVHKNIKLPGIERKSVLKKTIGKRLPQSILKAPKRGFVVPVREWFKDKDFSDRLQDLSKNSIGLESRAITKILEDNSNGLMDNGNFIWMLFVLDKWYNK